MLQCTKTHREKQIYSLTHTHTHTHTCTNTTTNTLCKNTSHAKRQPCSQSFHATRITYSGLLGNYCKKTREERIFIWNFSGSPSNEKWLTKSKCVLFLRQRRLTTAVITEFDNGLFKIIGCIYHGLSLEC